MSKRYITTQKVDSKAKSAAPVGPFSEFSCQFDGVDDTINFGSTAFAFTLSESISFGFWMKCTGDGGNYSIISKYKFDYNQDGYAIVKDRNERLSFLISQGWYPVLRVRTNNSRVTLNTWQHWVVTKAATPINSPPSTRIASASEVKIYRNGVLETLNTIDDSGPTDMVSSANFCFGSANNLEEYYQGFLDEVSIWNKELSQTEVTELYNSGVVFNINDHSAASNLKGYYRCGEEDTYPSFSDFSDNGFGNGGFMQGMTASNFVTDVP